LTPLSGYVLGTPACCQNCWDKMTPHERACRTEAARLFKCFDAAMDHLRIVLMRLDERLDDDKEEWEKS